MKISRINFIIIGMLTFSSPLFSQVDYNKIKIASPNAASLGKFGDIPVNNHTGIPKIDIPIYTLKEGNLELPISVNYHAGGIKVAESASWVGAGWALNAGGVITRTVRGIPDEAINTELGQQGHYTGYGFNSIFINKGVNINPSQIAARDLEVERRILDGEPDLFSFNFNDYSGKFYFNDDRTPVLVTADKNLKIESFYGLPANSASFLNRNIQGFCITTEDGTKYFFGKTTSADAPQGINAVEISVPFSFGSGLSSDRVVSSWYLAKIESADKSKWINLIYESENYSEYSWSYSPILETVTEFNNKGYILNKTFYNGVRLSRIQTSSYGNIDFNVSNTPRLDLAGGNFTTAQPDIEAVNTSAKALREIVIKNSTQVLKRFTFYTSYFIDNQTPIPATDWGAAMVSDTKRLKLDSITESGSTGYTLKPHKFSYYSNFLPRRLSFAIDHWGYYNAASNSRVLPTLTRDTYEFINKNGANRESAWPAMQEGALNKVTFPTGGNTLFEFEANRARVDALRYSLTFINNYSVGFDGSYTQEFNNVSFTGSEKYELTFVNSTCYGNIPNCAANYVIFNSNNVIVAKGASLPGETTRFSTTIPPGNYTIRLFRDGAYTTTGATLSVSKYIQTQVTDPIVGGLRIKKITKNAGSTSLENVEEFSYQEAGRSSGILYSRPYYIATLRSDAVAQWGIHNTSQQEGCQFLYGHQDSYKTIISPSSAIPMTNVQGNHLGYSTVTVRQGSNGYSVYKYYGPSILENSISEVAFTNIVSNFCDPKSPSFPNIPLAYQFDRGELKSEYIFDSNDQLLKSKNFIYAFDSTKVYTPALKVEEIPQLAHTLAEYKLYGYWKKYVVKNETYIDKASFKAINTSDTTFFNSNYHRSPTKLVSKNSNGSTSSKTFKYAFDYKLPAENSISDGWSTYQSACNACDVTFKAKISASPGPSEAAVESRKLAFHENRICIANARKRLTDHRLASISGPNNATNTAHFNAKINASSELKPILEMQDQYINAEVEALELNNNRLVSATLNTFALEQNGASPFIESVSVMPINSTTTNGFITTSNTNTLFTKDTRYIKRILYKAVNGNLVEENRVQGAKVTYLWGYKNTLPVAKIVNSDYNSIASTVNQAILDNPTSEQGLKDEFSRLRLASPNAHIVSYTYEPLIGLKSETDARGITKSYEYDDFQRLKNVKDYKGNITDNYRYYSGSTTSPTQPILFTNDLRTGTFIKNNCVSGQIGSSVVYSVPANKYTAESKAAANALADGEIASQGQSYANLNGSCSVRTGQLTINIKNAFSREINFMIMIDGYSATGPRSVGANSTNVLFTGLGPVNPSSLTITVFPEGYFPGFATAQGFWGTKQGVIDVIAKTITFTGLNLTQAQSFDIHLN
jgi:YD repeat-containing protein